MRNKELELTINGKLTKEHKDAGIPVFDTISQSYKEEFRKRYRVKCKICNNDIRLGIIARHMRKVHNKKVSQKRIESAIVIPTARCE